MYSARLNTRAGMGNYSLTKNTFMLLVSALAILAYPKTKQVNFLIELGTLPSTDELAIQFDEAYKVFLGIVNENKKYPYSKDLFKILDAINSVFDEMSNKSNNDFWETTSLSGVEWNKVRELAKEALQLMGEPIKKPD